MKKENIYILSIETSGKTCGVTLRKDKESLFTENISEPNMHDKLLATLVRAAMGKLHGDYALLDAIAVSAGPGSFTGLRIGASLAKGIVFDSNIKLLPVPTLDAIAWHYLQKESITGQKQIIATIPSHKNLYYIKIFNPDFNIKEDIQLIKPENISDYADDNSIFVGPGAAVFIKNDINGITGGLNSEIIANYANKLYFENQFVDADEFVPMYAQDFKPKTMENAK
jgi:tRNA threonylcarbamoyladenosine biosynthesis protein TsaB